MAHINRKYIDKHWFVFVLRGALGLVFGWFALFGNLNNFSLIVSAISTMLLFMGIIDASGALYNSTKKRGWFNSIFDATIDIISALTLLFFAENNLVLQLIIISAYVFLSGLIDIIHGFISTVDPTDRFIRILAGICGGVMGFVILNAGNFEIMTFIRFFGAYMLIVGVSSLVYGVHNRSQNIEDKIARSASARQKSTKKSRR